MGCFANRGCFLTSSLIATVAISLTIPMSMFADVMFKRVNYPSMFYIGSVPMFLAFFAVTLLAHYENWDPVMEGIRRCYIFVCRRSRPVR
jgi:solute carrier family 35 protein F5